MKNQTKTCKNKETLQSILQKMINKFKAGDSYGNISNINIELVN